MQSDYHVKLDTRIIAPIYQDTPQNQSKKLPRLSVMVSLNDADYFINFAEIAVIETELLIPFDASLSAYHHEITDALDFLFQGY